MANGGRSTGQTVTPGAGGSVRQEYGGLELRQNAERAALSRAAHSEALVKARVALAIQNPRDTDRARQKILADAKRPVFAERAIYSKPVGGKKIEGPSVRLAESLARAWGNIFIENTITYEDAETRTVHVLVMDVEENVTSAGEITIEKTVERREAKDRTVLSERMNSSGQKTFRVLATEDELLNKMNAAISKMRRNKIIEMLPFDLVQEALDICRKTMKDADAQDPEATKRRILDAFLEIGVDADDVKEYLGRSDLDVLTPAEMADLRKAYAAIDSEGHTWGEVMDLRREHRRNKTTAPPTPPSGAPAGAPTSQPGAGAASPQATASPPPAGGAPVADQPSTPPPPRPQEPSPGPAPADAKPPAGEAPKGPTTAEDDVGNKVADEYEARMRAAAAARDVKKLISEANAASKDARVPVPRRKPIGELFAKLKQEIGQGGGA